MVTTLGEGEIFGQPYKCTYSQLKTQYYQIKVKERITTGFHCLNFGDITHIRILLLQNMSPCSTHSEIKELKHQTFLFHKQHGWPRRTGSGTRFTCQNANHWANQCETITKAYRIIHLKLSFKSFVSFLRRKHDFRQRICTYVWRISSLKNPEFEPLVSTWELAFWSLWPQLKNVLTWAVAFMLQKYFLLVSVVPRTSGS